MSTNLKTTTNAHVAITLLDRLYGQLLDDWRDVSSSSPSSSAFQWLPWLDAWSEATAVADNLPPSGHASISWSSTSRSGRTSNNSSAINIATELPLATTLALVTRLQSMTPALFKRGHISADDGNGGNDTASATCDTIAQRLLVPLIERCRAIDARQHGALVGRVLDLVHSWQSLLPDRCTTTKQTLQALVDEYFLLSNIPREYAKSEKAVVVEEHGALRQHLMHSRAAIRHYQLSQREERASTASPSMFRATAAGSIPNWIEGNLASPDAQIRELVLDTFISAKPVQLPSAWTRMKDKSASAAFKTDEFYDRDARVQIRALELVFAHTMQSSLPNGCVTARADVEDFNFTLLLDILCFYALDIRLDVRVKAISMIGRMGVCCTRRQLQQMLEKKPLFMANVQRHELQQKSGKNYETQITKKQKKEGGYPSQPSQADPSSSTIIPSADGDAQISRDTFQTSEDVTHGVLVYGLEDEYEEMRLVTIDALCALVGRDTEFRRTVTVYLIDMFNDEIADVRLKAIESVRDILREYSDTAALRPDNLGTILTSRSDTDIRQRHALIQCLSLTVINDGDDVLGNIINRLLDHIEHYPEDRMVVLDGCRELGSRFCGSLDFFPKLFSYDWRYDPLPPLVADIKYTAIHIFAYNALRKLNALPMGEDGSSLGETTTTVDLRKAVPPYFFKHLRFFRFAFPRQYIETPSHDDTYWDQAEKRVVSSRRIADQGAELTGSLQLYLSREELAAAQLSEARVASAENTTASLAWDRNRRRTYANVGSIPDKPMLLSTGGSSAHIPLDLWAAASYISDELVIARQCVCVRATLFEPDENGVGRIPRGSRDIWPHTSSSVNGRTSIVMELRLPVPTTFKEHLVIQFQLIWMVTTSKARPLSAPVDFYIRLQQ